MKLFRVTAEAGNDINFRSEISSWKELPQVDHDYVVHARCLVIDGDVWIDHYNLMLDFQNWWNESLSEEYNYDNFKDAQSVAFHVTGSNSVFVEYPKLDSNCSKEKWYLGKTLEKLGADDDSVIEWGEGHITFGDLIIDES